MKRLKKMAIGQSIKILRNPIYRKLRRFTYLAAFVCLFSADPPVFADESLFGDKPTLLLAGAKKIADACEAFAVKKELKLSIAIIDEAARPILFRRMPGASLASIELARGKAKTAVLFPVPTRVMTEYVHGKDGQPGKSPGLAYMEGLIALTGGLPIKVGEQAVGAIGVSGAASDQDEACAKVGLDALNK